MSHVLLKRVIRGEVWAMCECGALIARGPIPAELIGAFTGDLCDIHRDHVRRTLRSGGLLLEMPALEPGAQEDAREREASQEAAREEEQDMRAMGSMGIIGAI
jgi:hypothetical protein